MNFTGTIFAMRFLMKINKNEILNYKDNYHDKTGKNSTSDSEVIKNFIDNIYNTGVLKSINETYVYPCNKDLRLYLKSCTKNYKFF